MPPLARVVGLYCGQGMAPLVEIYDSGVAGPVADPLVLVDFGGTPEFSHDAVSYVFARLKARSDAGRTASFGLTVISHRDEDHVVLLGPLADKIPRERLAVAFGLTPPRIHPARSAAAAPAPRRAARAGGRSGPCRG